MCVIRRFTHRPPGNGESDASIAFWLRKGHSAGKPLPQLAIREDAKFFVQNWTKRLFFANKDPKNNFDAWMILQKPVLSFKCNDLKKKGQFEGDNIFCHLNYLRKNAGHFCLALNVVATEMWLQWHIGWKWVMIAQRPGSEIIIKKKLQFSHKKMSSKISSPKSWWFLQKPLNNTKGLWISEPWNEWL